MSFEGSKAVLLKDISGNVARIDISGNLQAVIGSAANFSVDISGDPVNLVSGTGPISVTSGTGVRISGETVVTTISGQTVAEAGSIFRTRISGYLPVTDASGGASVGSGVVGQGVMLRNMSGTVNGIIWVGGSGTNLAPFSGHGYPLLTDDQITLKVSNFLQLRVVANLSGVFLAATGVDF